MGIPIYCFLITFQLYYFYSTLWEWECVLPSVFRPWRFSRWSNKSSKNDFVSSIHIKGDLNIACTYKTIQESGTNRVMTMAFITLNSSLVPWLRVYVAQIRLDSSCRCTVTCFVFLFWPGDLLQEKAVSPRSLPASQHIYAQVYFVHIHEYKYAEI